MAGFRLSLSIILLHFSSSSFAQDYYSMAQQNYFNTEVNCISHRGMHLLGYYSQTEWAQVKTTSGCYLTKGSRHSVTYTLPFGQRVSEVCHTHTTTGASPQGRDQGNCDHMRQSHPGMHCCVISVNAGFAVSYY